MKEARQLLTYSKQQQQIIIKKNKTNKKHLKSGVGAHIFNTRTERQRQADLYELEASLVYRVNSMPQVYKVRPCLKTNKNYPSRSYFKRGNL